MKADAMRFMDTMYLPKDPKPEPGSPQASKKPTAASDPNLEKRLLY
jgi:hypothetical protein